MKKPIYLLVLLFSILLFLFMNCKRNKDFDSFYSGILKSKFLSEYYGYEFYNHLRNVNSFSLEFNDSIRNEHITVDFELKSNWRNSYRLLNINAVYISGTLDRYRLDSIKMEDKLIEERIQSFLLESKKFSVLELSSDSICKRIMFDLNHIVESSRPAYSLNMPYDKSKYFKVGVLDFVNHKMIENYKKNAFFGPDYEYSFQDYRPVEIENNVFFYHELHKKSYE